MPHQRFSVALAAMLTSGSLAPPVSLAASSQKARLSTLLLETRSRGLWFALVARLILIAMSAAVVSSSSRAALPPPLAITNNTIEDSGAHMAVGPTGSIHLAWHSATGVWYSRSDDGGVTFSPAARVAPSGSNCDIALGGSGEIVVLIDDSYLYTSLSLDGGTTFLPTHQVSTIAAESPGALAVDTAGHLHVVWVNAQVVRYAQSVDSGTTFSTPISINPGAFVSAYPAVAADPDGNPHIDWVGVTLPANGAINYSRSDDHGLTFRTPIAITDGSNQGDLPSIAVGADGVVHLAWRWGNQMAYSRSVDGGASFSPGEVVLWEPPGTNGANYSAIAVRGSKELAMAGALFSADGSSRLHIGVSHDGGLTFNHRLIAETALYMRYADVGMLPDGEVAAVWDAGALSNLDTFEIYFAVGDASTFVDVSGGDADPRPKGFRIVGTTPNPARSGTRLTWTSDCGGTCDAKLFDVADRVAESWRLPGSVQGATRVADLPIDPALPAAVYFLRLSQGSHSAVARIAILH